MGSGRRARRRIPRRPGSAWFHLLPRILLTTVGRHRLERPKSSVGSADSQLLPVGTADCRLLPVGSADGHWLPPRPHESVGHKSEPPDSSWMGSSRLLPHKGYGGLSLHWLLLRHLARHGLLDKNPMNRARCGVLRLFSVVNCVDQCAFRERAEWARVSEAALCSVDELRCFLSGGSRWVRALPG